MEDRNRFKTKIFNPGMIKDFAWYFASSLLPLIVGFLKTPIFTREFSTEAFGSLGIVQISYTYLGMILFSWISSCLWRYYQKFKLEEKSGVLNGSLVLLAAISLTFLLVISAFWYAQESNSLIRKLIVYSVLHLIFNQFLMAYLVIVRLEAKAKLYTLIQSIKAVIGFGLSLFLVFYLKKDISALVGSLALTDGLILLIILLWNPAKIALLFKGIRRQDLKSFLFYGSAGLVVNMSLLSLNLSDRYVILHADGLSSVGIYDQVYKIALLSVSTLVTVFFNTINPDLFRALENNYKDSMGPMGSYLYLFLILGFPLVLYLSLYSREISILLLGPEFREAYKIMPFVFFAAFLQGWSNFYELRLKFSDQMRFLGMVFLGAAILNLLLNLWWIPVFGYLSASYSTLLSFVCIILIFHINDPSLVASLFEKKKKILQFTGILLIQTIVFMTVKIYDPSIMYLIILGLIFVFSYGWSIKKSLEA